MFSEALNNGMSKEDIQYYLELLNEKLKLKGRLGQIYMVGGAVMCLCFEARLSTIDIDAVFKPQRDIELCIAEISKEHSLPITWLNDICYQFLSDKGEFKLFLELSNLNIHSATAEYMLAMKCFSLRTGNKNEMNDIEFLIKFLHIKSVEEIYKIITKFYALDEFKNTLPFVLKEILENE